MFNVFQNKSESKDAFGCPFELFEGLIQFLVEEEFVEKWHGEIKNTMCTFLKLRVNEKMIARIEFFF